RYDAEVVERVLAPAQKRVSLLVAQELELRVQLKRIGTAEVGDLHRMVDDELDRLQRVYFVRIAAEADDPVAHRREIDDGGNPSEVLEQDARGRERDLLLRATREIPPREGFDVRRLHEAAVLVPKQVLEKDLHRVWQARNFAEALGLERRKALDVHACVGELKR